jgi:hypothetical protein
MTVYHMGSELDSFERESNSILEVTTALRFDATFSRCAIGVGNGNRNLGILSPVFGPVTKCYFHFNSAMPAVDASASFPFRVFNSVGVPVFAIRTIGTTAVWQAAYWNGAAWVTTGATFVVSTSGLTTFDIYLDMSTGNYEIKRAEISVSSGTFPTNPGPFINNIARYGLYPVGNGAIGSNSCYSQCVAADFDLTNYRVYTSPPVSAGNSVAWTGTVADVDEIALNDNDFITSATNDQIEQFIRTAISIPSGTIAAIAVNARVTANPGGPQSVRSNIRIGTTDYFNSFTFAPGTGFKPYCSIWTVNPATSLPFTIAEAGSAAIQYGLQSRA